MRPALDFQQDPDGPDFLGLQGWFLPDDPAFAPRYLGRLGGVSESRGLHDLIRSFYGMESEAFRLHQNNRFRAWLKDAR